MNITIISYGHIDSITALAKYLALRGNKVTLILVVYDDFFHNSIVNFDLRKLTFGLHHLNRLKGQSTDVDNLLDYSKNYDIFLLKLPSRSLKDLRNIKFIREVSKFIYDIHSDIIHFNGDSAHQITFYSFLRKFPKILTIHDYEPHSGEDKNWYKNYLFRKIHYRSDYKFILHSNYYREKMLKDTRIDENRIKTIYFAPFDFYNYYKNFEIKENFPSAIFFGRISPYKGIEYFCKAIEIVEKKIPQAKFFILGNGKFYFDVNYYLEKLPIILINEYIDNQTLSDFIMRASLVVLPYKDATQSGSVITAYSFNKPVIATKVGGIPEIVLEGETGFLVEPQNHFELAKKIIYLFKNKKVIENMNEKINCFKKDFNNRIFSWEKIAEETEFYYKDF